MGFKATIEIDSVDDYQKINGKIGKEVVTKPRNICPFCGSEDLIPAESLHNVEVRMVDGEIIPSQAVSIHCNSCGYNHTVNKKMLKIND